MSDFGCQTEENAIVALDAAMTTGRIHIDCRMAANLIGQQVEEVGSDDYTW